MRISDWSSDVCSSDLPPTSYPSTIPNAASSSCAVMAGQSGGSSGATATSRSRPSAPPATSKIEDEMTRLSWLAIPLALGATEATARVDMMRTSYGVPHITASDYTGLGYGQGYAEATDNLCVIAEYLVTLRGERSLYFGAEGANAKNVGSDFFARYYYRDATRRQIGRAHV